MTFLDQIGNPDLDVVLNFEMEPWEELSAAAGHVWVHLGVVAPNCYGAIAHYSVEHVEVNGQELVEVEDLPTLDATEGAVLFGDNNTVVMVHLAGAKDPSASPPDLVLAFHWEYFTTRQADPPNAIEFNLKWFLPYVDKDSIPDLEVSVADFAAGGVNSSFGTVVLFNTDGYFDTRLGHLNYGAVKCSLLIGLVGDIRSGYINYWPGWTGKVTANDLKVSFEIESLTRFAE